MDPPVPAGLFRGKGINGFTMRQQIAELADIVFGNDAYLRHVYSVPCRYQAMEGIDRLVNDGSKDKLTPRMLLLLDSLVLELLSSPSCLNKRNFRKITNKAIVRHNTNSI